jgi:hypothetical protein
MRERAQELALGQADVLRKFSLEYITIGRNDDHTPNWLPKLESVIGYNRSLFASSGIDFRFAFVEWNPPPDRPLLAPYLVGKYPFARAIVVEPQVHDTFREHNRLKIVICLAWNVAIRTSEADFVLLSSAEDYLGRDVARWLLRRGLRKGCLYRAMKVDIQKDFDFRHPDAKVLEARHNIVRVQHVTAPPYDHAPGDFLLMDRASMHLIRGFDEALLGADTAIDSRFCASAMALGLSCRLIGRVYHIDHESSSDNSGARGNLTLKEALANVPYKNPETWGLANRNWVKRGERLSYVG